MLTRQEKERLIVNLYNQGKTIREIAKEVRISFRDIGAILKKASGEKDEKQDIKQPLASSTKAYRLFSRGKTPISVAITLNLSEAETTKFYEEYCNLNRMHELRVVYDEIGDDITHFLQLYRLSKGACLDPKRIVKLLQTANDDLPSLELKYRRLRKEIDLLELEKQESMDLGNQVKTLTNVLDEYKEEIKNLHKKKARLEALMSSDHYKRVKQVAEEEVINSLSENKYLLKLAISSVIESIIKDPDKYNFMINSSQFNQGQESASSTPKYIEIYRSIVQDDAEKLFEAMKSDLTNRIINNAPLAN